MNYSDKNDLLSKLGLVIKPSTGQSLVSTLAPFGVGILVGAGVALLFAPRSGPELRDNIRQKVSHDGFPGLGKMKTGNGKAESERIA